MNVVNYPRSGNVYDSYADLLAAKKDTVKALSNYEKAYAITKSEETKQKMDQLLGKSTFKPSVKDLEKYVGVFDFESVSVTATTSIKDGALWINATGQGDFELIPLSRCATMTVPCFFINCEKARRAAARTVAGSAVFSEEIEASTGPSDFRFCPFNWNMLRVDPSGSELSTDVAAVMGMKASTGKL